MTSSQVGTSQLSHGEREVSQLSQQSIDRGKKGKWWLLRRMAAVVKAEGGEIRLSSEGRGCWATRTTADCWEKKGEVNTSVVTRRAGTAVKLLIKKSREFCQIGENVICCRVEIGQRSRGELKQLIKKKQVRQIGKKSLKRVEARASSVERDVETPRR